MFIVVAPALITFSIISQRKLKSDLPASSGENSTSSALHFAILTALIAFLITCSGVIFSFISICIGDVAMNV